MLCKFCIKGNFGICFSP